MLVFIRSHFLLKLERENAQAAGDADGLQRIQEEIAVLVERAVLKSPVPYTSQNDSFRLVFCERLVLS